MTATRRRGDTWVIAGQITDGGAPVDLTGATVTAQLRARVAGPVVATWGVDVTDPAEGKVTLTLAHTVTQGLRPADYLYDLRVEGERVATYGAGPKAAKVSCVPAITSAPPTEDEGGG